MKFSIEKYKHFEYIFSLTQEKMKHFVAKELHKYYSSNHIHETKDYIYATGTIPIALIAHLDTVWEDEPSKFIFFDPFKNVMWSMFGLGADDRAGCIGILEILETGLRPHIIFTTDEECGGLGAYSLASEPCPFDNLNYIIELDRQGNNDCVFYDCESKNFQKYIETFGFKKAQGTFSDISIICGSWEVCGVNLSIGYLNEHTRNEMLFLASMYNTISRVCKMLSVKQIPKFKWEGLTYIPQRINYNWDNPFSNLLPYEVACKKCHIPLDIQNVIGAENSNNGISYYCFNCMQKCVSYCPVCGIPFENSEGITSQKLCFNCRGKIKEEENDDLFEF